MQLGEVQTHFGRRVAALAANEGNSGSSVWATTGRVQSVASVPVKADPSHDGSDWKSGTGQGDGPSQATGPCGHAQSVIKVGDAGCRKTQAIWVSGLRRGNRLLFRSAEHAGCNTWMHCTFAGAKATEHLPCLIQTLCQ